MGVLFKFSHTKKSCAYKRLKKSCTAKPSQNFSSMQKRSCTTTWCVLSLRVMKLCYKSRLRWCAVFRLPQY